MYNHTREPHTTLLTADAAGQSPNREIIAGMLGPELIDSSALSRDEQLQLASVLAALGASDPRSNRGNAGPADREPPSDQVRYNADGSSNNFGSGMSQGWLHQLGILHRP